MSNKGGRVSPDYLADIAPEYALVVLKFILKISHWVVYIMETQDFANTIRCIIHSALIMVGVVC